MRESSTQADGLAHEIESYWDGRSTTYSNGVRGELADDRREWWRRAAERISEAPFAAARSQGRMPRVLDLGCGPGFFSIMFAQMGCEVDAVDMSSQMLARARENAAGQAPGAPIRFYQGDMASLPFDDDTFDLAVSRNVTWLLREPEATYAEWLRVLRPGGKMAAFDANWYRYLTDANLAAARLAALEGNAFEGWDENARATSDEEKRCEEIARELPLTYELRPAWDLKVLSGLEAVASADDSVWRELWNDAEKESYCSWTTLFLVEAVKQPLPR